MCNDSSFNTTTWVLVITKWVRGTAQDPRWIKQILLFKKLKSQSRDTEVVGQLWLPTNTHKIYLRQQCTLLMSLGSGGQFWSEPHNCVSVSCRQDRKFSAGLSVIAGLSTDTGVAELFSTHHTVQQPDHSLTATTGTSKEAEICKCEFKFLITSHLLTVLGPVSESECEETTVTGQRAWLQWGL